MPILSNVILQDLSESTQPITLPSELGWSVKVLCTGTTPLSERRLCVLGCSLDGHWFRPPKTFTDEMVVLILLARKDPQYYSIVNVPYEHGKCASWYADWDTRLVDFYKTVVKDLFSLKVSSKMPIFFGVSAGVLGAMVLLTSLMKDTDVHMSKPIAVFVAGAWHPRAHPEFLAAVRSQGCAGAHPQIFVVNHEKDRLCSWWEQKDFWYDFKEKYWNLLLVVLKYNGTAAADLFDPNYHDSGSRIAASMNFWVMLLESPLTGMTFADWNEFQRIAEVACDWNEQTRTTPFPGYARLLGLRLLCRFWRHMRSPTLEQDNWSLALLRSMRQMCNKACSQMFRDECLSGWPICLGSSKIGEYFMPQLCDNIANSVQDGILYSDIQDTSVELRHLHDSKDMNLVEITFKGKSPWLSTRWKQEPAGKLVHHETVILTHPCIVILRFNSGPCLLGFYSSHEKRKSNKRRVDGPRINYPQDLRSVVLACTPESVRDFGTQNRPEIRTCNRIEIMPLTNLMGVGSLGPMIFPPESFHKFGAWIAKDDSVIQVPDSFKLNVANFHDALHGLPLFKETKKSLSELIPLVQRNLMTAVIGPPGTGKTTNISGLLSMLLSHHRRFSTRKTLRLFLCAPTNHAVKQLEDIVSELTSNYDDVAFIRICSARMMKGKGNGKGNGKGKLSHTSDTSVVDCPAQHVDVNALKEGMQNNTKNITIILSTLGALQKSPSAFYDPLHCIQKYFDWILVDEGGQAVDTDAYTLHQFLSSDGGRYVFFGDPKQLSCYSTLRLPRRSAMQAALECGTKWMCLKDCFRLKGTLGQFFCQTIYEAEGMRLHHEENICSLVFIEIWDEPGKKRTGELRCSDTSAQLENKIMEYLSSRRRKKDEVPHYITFYSDQNKLFRSKLRPGKTGFGIHTVDASQGLDSKGHALLSMGRRHGVGFLSDIRRLIVSLSRSQKSTIMIVHSSVVNTNHSVACVFQALRKIAQRSDAYVLLNNKNTEHSFAVVQQTLQKRNGIIMKENSAEVVSQSLAQSCPRSKKSIKRALGDYMQTSLARFQVAGIVDEGEITKPDTPQQNSDSEDSTTDEPGNAALSAPVQPPTGVPLQYNPNDWALLRIKNLNVIPAKFKFDTEKWPGDDNGAHRVIKAMAEAFAWSDPELTWFRRSEKILWKFSKGAKPNVNGKYFHDNITGKTKIFGLLPFKLFPKFLYDGIHEESKKPLYGKTLFTAEEARSTSYSANTPKGWDWSKKKILLEVFFQGTARDSLEAFSVNSKFRNFFSTDSLHLRHSRIVEWNA